MRQQEVIMPDLGSEFNFSWDRISPENIQSKKIIAK